MAGERSTRTPCHSRHLRRDRRERALVARRRHAVRVARERRLRRQAHRIAVHVVAQGDEIRQRDRALGLHGLVGIVACCTTSASSSTACGACAGTLIIQPKLSTPALPVTVPPSSSASSAIWSASGARCP